MPYRTGTCVMTMSVTRPAARKLRMAVPEEQNRIAIIPIWQGYRQRKSMPNALFDLLNHTYRVGNFVISRHISSHLEN